jgi:hypothetical protein
MVTGPDWEFAAFTKIMKMGNPVNTLKDVFSR